MTIIVASCTQEGMAPLEEFKTPYLTTDQPLVSDSLDYYYNKLYNEFINVRTAAMTPEDHYETIADLCTNAFGEHLWELPSTVPTDSAAVYFDKLIDDSALSTVAKRRLRIMTDTLLIPRESFQYGQLYDHYGTGIENDTLLQPGDKRVLLGTLWFITELTQEEPIVGTLSEDEDDDEDREDEDWDLSVGHVYKWLEGNLQSDAQGIYNALIMALDND